MTIRQTSSAGVANDVTLSVFVKTSHPLIGEAWYAPEVKVTNASGLPVTITSVELVTGRTTYLNKPLQSETHPVIVAPRGTETLEVRFSLNKGVKRIFEQPATLRVRYRSAGKEGNTQANLVGGPLDKSVP